MTKGPFKLTMTPSGKGYKLVPMGPAEHHHKIIPMLPEQQMILDDEYYIDWTNAECDINCTDAMCPYTHPVRRLKGDQHE